MFDVVSLVRRSSRACASSVIAAVFAALPLLASADTLELKPDHPDRYTVVKGDTLWDISGRFLTEPWRWPEIWEDNPQIKNPNLIYPGDELVLTYKEGRPLLRRIRSGVVKLSPTVRATSLEGGAVPPIPVDALAQFLSRPRVVTEEQMDDAPYIVSVGSEHLIGGAGTKVFVRGLQDPAMERYAVYRRGAEYTDPDNADVSLGFAGIHVADVVMREKGDPATMMVTTSTREVLAGDRLLPAEEDGGQLTYVPHAPKTTVAGRVIGVEGGLTQAGQHQLVVVNLGARDGIEPGHVLAIYQRGEEITDNYAQSPRADVPEPEAYIERDPDKQGGLDGFSIAADRLVRAIEDAVTPEDTSYKRVRLPDQRAGVVMVIRRFDRVSYGLVMQAERAIHVEDSVRNP